MDPFLSQAEKDIGRATVSVPGVGDVIVRGLTVEEYDAIEAKAVREVDGKSIIEPSRPLLIRYGCIKEDGSHRFTDDDLPAIRRLPLARAIPLCREITRLSKLDETTEQVGKG